MGNTLILISSRWVIEEKGPFANADNSASKNYWKVTNDSIWGRNELSPEKVKNLSIKGQLSEEHNAFFNHVWENTEGKENFTQIIFFFHAIEFGISNYFIILLPLEEKNLRNNILSKVSNENLDVDLVAFKHYDSDHFLDQIFRMEKTKPEISKWSDYIASEYEKYKESIS